VVGGACDINGGREKCIQCSVGKREGKYHFEDLGVDGSTILKCILNRMGCGSDSFHSGYGEVSACCVHSNKYTTK